MQELLGWLVLNMCVLFVKCDKLSANLNNQSPESDFDCEYLRTNITLNPDLNLSIEATAKTISLSLQIKNESETFRGLMDKTSSFLPSSNSPMLSYMLAPALTLAGLIPWIVPGIQMAAGFVQMINQVAFSAGLIALVRSYVFDGRPDEHVIYVNHGYGVKGHTKNHYGKL